MKPVHSVHHSTVLANYCYYYFLFKGLFFLVLDAKKVERKNTVISFLVFRGATLIRPYKGFNSVISLVILLIKDCKAKPFLERKIKILLFCLLKCELYFEVNRFIYIPPSFSPILIDVK